MQTIIEKYRCWQEGFSDSESIVVEAHSPVEAAWKAVDQWRFEGFMTHSLPTTTVFVRDSYNKENKIFVNQERFIDSSGPNV